MNLTGSARTTTPDVQGRNLLVPLASRKRQRLETRNRIFDAAIAEYARVGVAEADVGRIVRSAGVAWGTFFFHFPSKTHVLAELGHRLELKMVHRLRKAWGRHRSLSGLLNSLVDALREGQDAIGNLRLTREVLFIYVARPDGVDLQRNGDGLLAVVTSYFVEAAEKKIVRDDVTADELAKTLLTMVFGFLLQSETPLRERRAELRRMMDIFQKGATP